MRVFEELLDMGKIKRRVRGRPRVRPRTLLADRGYSSKKARRACQVRGIKLVTPPKKDHQRKVPYDKVLYRLRNRVEQLVNRLKRLRHIATRYEKRAVFHGAFLTIAFVLEWL